MISVPLWLSGAHECSYLSGRIANSLVVRDDFMLDTQLYSELIKQGFRRSGDQVYRPFCQSCQACIPTRLAVHDFQPNRKQKRCLKINAGVESVIRPAEFDPRHLQLYQRYQAARHSGADNDPISADQYREFLCSSWCDSWFVEFSIAGRLAAVAVVDVLEQALSAVYTFFDPEFAAYSPGVYAVLWQIRQAQRMNLDYVYLGFWIGDCRKMAYKIEYQPLSGLIDRQWRPLSIQH
ncbi:MAG: arginyltransferase [Methylomonas sp.]|jgi:arginine-tRNA-protein transferase